MNQSKKKFIWLPLLIAVVLALGIFGGNYLAQISMSGNGRNISGGNKISSLMNLIDQQYVDTININEITEKAIPKIMSELDPHSTYIPAKDLEETTERLEGSFSGIGIQFNMLTDTINVVSVIPGGPSEKVGILAGDRIVTINDTTFVGKEITTTQIMKRLRGKKGTSVKVGIKRSNAKDLLSFDITRGDIPLTTVDASFMVDDKTGYIKISDFGRTTYDEFLNALAKLKNNGATGYIIDLRQNGGGYMDVAVNMVNEFLPKNKLIVYAEGKTMPRNESISNGTGSFQQTPVVVLIDEFSASASEIFSGAIQDNDRGTIIGRRSFGKGLVQQQIPFKDGSAVRLTIARYYTPSGRSIQKEYQLGNNENYEQDFVNRFMHGEMDSQDSIKQNDSLLYYTSIGRKVYGGGGIMPDIFVPRDTSHINSYYINVMNSGLVYQFAFNYADTHRKTLKALGDYKKVVAYLQSQPILDEFTTFAFNKGVKRRPVYIEMSKNLLLNQLYAYIIRNTLDEESFYQVFLSDDKTILKAKEILQKGESVPKAPETENSK